VSRSHGASEFLDPQDPRRSDRPESSRAQDQGSNPQEDGRLTPNRAPEPAPARSGELRETFEVREKTYRLRSSEIQALAELGKFRAAATEDLQRFAYQGLKDNIRAGVQNLIRQGLIAEKKIAHPETNPRRLLTLSKQGHQFLTVTRRVPKNQATHCGFTKPREAHHDADLYRMYYTAAGKIERQDGRNLRVILDYELNKHVYHDLAKFGPHRESTAKRTEIAERHGAKIPLPDLRIDYETREGEMDRVDLELATEHYRGRNMAEKVRAGFSIYARAQDAAGLRRVLDQRELTAEILSL
jgi:hypothetical protein